MKYLAISILFSFYLFQEAFGHGKKIFFVLISFPFTTLNLFPGGMYFPPPWWATSPCTPDDGPWDCWGNGKLNLGDTGCTPRPEVPDHPGCVTHPWSGQDDFFTNFTFVEKKTIPDEFIDKEVGSTHWVTGGLHPWNSPGAAPTFGNGCGVSGGNPLPKGCLGEGMQICTEISIIVTSHERVRNNFTQISRS